MRIELHNLEEGKGVFTHAYEPGQLDLADERVSLCGPTAVSGKIRKVGAELIVSGRLETCAQVDCDRCLQPIQLPISSDFSLEYISDSDYEMSHTPELTEDLMGVSVFDGESIDIDEVVKEQLLLSIPSRVLCREECMGFCEKCGADKNAGDCGCVEKEIDPRWAALKELRNGKS